MSKILKLPKHLSDKIAAGEVVTGPLSVVKELVENSIDAGADNIIIEIKEGGKSFIRVTDNGSGIPADEVELAFKPHATSKIADEKDLNNINTLGFRGEALTSIAAVSKLEMITMTEESRVGTSIYIEGGDILEVKDTGSSSGTTIIVRDLFYNTPARLKFMKSDRSESTKIIDLISRLSIAYPMIKIRMINNDNILFSTTGKGDVAGTIFQVYGEVAQGELLKLKEETEKYALAAYISPSNLTKKSRKNQIYFVNGRVVNSKIIENAITKGYEEFVFEGRYPIAYVFLQVDPGKLDVNVHPAKTEVRFEKNEEISSFISSAIKSRLKTKDAIPDAVIPSLKDKPTRESIFNINSDSKDKESAPIKETPKQVNIKTLLSRKFEDDILEVKKEQTEISKTKQDPMKVAEQQNEIYEKESVPEIYSLEVLGTIFATYILAVDDDIFYIIDQHAAHERINYELFLKQYHSGDKLSQQILEPLIISVSPVSMNEMDEWIELINRLGYEAEIFGDKAVIVRAVPAFLEFQGAKDMLDDFFDDVNKGVPRNEKALEDLIQRSCKSSVKANDLLKPEEIRALLRDLSKCQNPFACPHGRPVFIKLTKYDVEKLFRRVH